MQRLLRSIVGIALAVLAAGAAGRQAQHAAAAALWHVAVTGVDNPACGTSPASACRTITYVLYSRPGFAAGDTVRLAGGVFTESVVFSKGAVIVGAGEAATTLSGAASRAITVNAGVQVTLDSLTLSNGPVSSGGAIWNDGTLSVLRASVTQTSAGAAGIGGGIYNNGALTVEDTTVSAGVAQTGGGLYNDSAGSAVLTRVTIDGNQASLEGGGIFNDGSLTLIQSVVQNNSTTAAATTLGAGISNNGIITIESTSVAANTTSGYGVGGGIYTRGQLEMRNSVVASNSAAEGGGINNEPPGRAVLARVTIRANDALSGGGVFNSSSAGFSASESAIVSNSADNFGGGVANSIAGRLIFGNVTIGDNHTLAGLGIGLDIADGPGFVSLSNVAIVSNTVSGFAQPAGAGVRVGIGAQVAMTGTLLAHNGTADCAVDQNGALVSFGNNLAAGLDCVGLNLPTDRLNLDPRLGQLRLADATYTYPLLRDSPAIDAFGPGAGCPTIDQRGLARPQGVACDIGPREATAIDLSVSAQASTPATALGTPVSFVAELHNTSALTATGAALTADIPASLSGATCATSQGTCVIAGGLMHADLQALPAGAKATVTLNGVPSQVGVMSVSFLGASDDRDPGDANDRAGADISIEALSDLTLAATGPAQPVASSGVVAIALVLSNLGPTASARPVITATLPPGATLFGYDGDAWTCQAAGATVVCSYLQAQLPVGPADPLRLIVQAPSATAPSQMYSVSAIAAAASQDPQPDNSASAGFTVIERYLVLLPIAVQQ